MPVCALIVKEVHLQLLKSRQLSLLATHPGTSEIPPNSSSGAPPCSVMTCLPSPLRLLMMSDHPWSYLTLDLTATLPTLKAPNTYDYSLFS